MGPRVAVLVSGAVGDRWRLYPRPQPRTRAVKPKSQMHTDAAKLVELKSSKQTSL